MISYTIIILLILVLTKKRLMLDGAEKKTFLTAFGFPVRKQKNTFVQNKDFWASITYGCYDIASSL